MSYKTWKDHLRTYLDRFWEDYTKKYTGGQREHGGNLWKKNGMVQRAKEEVLDQWSYLNTIEDQLRHVKDLLKDGDTIEAQRVIHRLLEKPTE